MRSLAGSALALGLVVFALPAFGAADELTNATSGTRSKTVAQAEPPPSGTAPESPSEVPPESTSNGANGPESDVPEKREPAMPAAGYAYSDRPAASSGRPHAKYRKSGPVVNIPGFEVTSDGGSRLFVQLSQRVPVEERKAQGTITYVLKGASPRVWNNTNALVTVHFNTPVSRARLVPRGRDLLFVVELRAAATPTWKMVDGPEGTATLMIDFPKGDYLGPSTEPPAEGETAAAPPPRKATHAKRGAAKIAPKKAAPAGPQP